MRRAPATRSGGWGVQHRPPAIYFGFHKPSHLNVLIVGGGPSRRRTLAHEYHQSSPLSDRGLAMFDAAQGADRLEGALLEWLGAATAAPGRTDPSGETPGTLFIDHVTALPPRLQSLLVTFAERLADLGPTGTRPARLVAACDEDPWLAVEAGRFSAELCDCLDKIRVELNAPRRRGAA